MDLGWGFGNGVWLGGFGDGFWAGGIWDGFGWGDLEWFWVGGVGMVLGFGDLRMVLGWGGYEGELRIWRVAKIPVYYAEEYYFGEEITKFAVCPDVSNIAHGITSHASIGRPGPRWCRARALSLRTAGLRPRMPTFALVKHDEKTWSHPLRVLQEQRYHTLAKLVCHPRLYFGLGIA